MGIMSVVMVIFTTAILQVYRSVNASTESLSTAQSQLQIAFQRFDRELRYASWIAEPGKVGTTWYVEYAACRSHPVPATPVRAPTTPAAPVSTPDGVLQLIRWTRGAPPAAGARAARPSPRRWSPEGADPSVRTPGRRRDAFRGPERGRRRLGA